MAALNDVGMVDTKDYTVVTSILRDFFTKKDSLRFILKVVLVFLLLAKTLKQSQPTITKMIFGPSSNRTNVARI